jgi:hypothetical protein
MLQANLRRVRQAQKDQQLRQSRRVKSDLIVPQRHIIGDWVKEKIGTTTASSVSVVDSRGKYLHSGT